MFDMEALEKVFAEELEEEALAWEQAHVKAYRVLEGEKGDKPGHEFHGNQWTGAGSGGDTAVAESNVTTMDRVTKIEEGELDEWSGMRAYYAGNAASFLERHQGQSVFGVASRSGGKTNGVAACKEFDDVVEVKFLATKERGLGSKMMAEVCKAAASKGKGVSLFADPGAEKFYEKLGMRHEGEGVYVFSADEAGKFSSKFDRKDYWEDLDRLEPESGTFARSVLEGEKSNPNHDEQGRFASGQGNVGIGSDSPTDIYKKEKPATEDAMRSGTIKDFEKVDKGNANAVYKVTLDDGSIGVFKPAGQEMPDLRTTVPAGSYYRREEAAYRVAKVVGMEDLVPVTVSTEGQKGDTGSMQSFVPDAKTAYEIWVDGSKEKYGSSEEDMHRAAAFDFVMGNVDRHPGNWMVDRSGKIHLIDNGLSLPEKGHDEDQGKQSRIENEFLYMGDTGFVSKMWRKPIDSNVSDSWQGKWPKIEKALRDSGIPDNAIKLTKDRYDLFTNEQYKTIGEVHGAMMKKIYGEN